MRVEALDTNDPPVVEPPGQFAIPANVVPGRTVGVVSANDPNGDGELRFGLTHDPTDSPDDCGEDDGTTSDIDESRKITLLGSPPPVGECVIAVIVLDQGIPVGSATAEITVEVVEVVEVVEGTAGEG